MKILTQIIIMGAVLSLLGCSTDVEVSTSNNKYDGTTEKAFTIACLDSIEYWSKGWSLTAKIDPSTRMPKRCERN